MPRPDPAIELTDAEKRALIGLIQAGKALPEKYRFLLFEDKREVELVWTGKTRDVCTTVLPLQTLEHGDEPRPEAKTSPQFDRFDARGRQTKGWTNKLIWGDNKLIFSSLKSGPLREQIEKAGGLKLIYIDPPFDVGADFSMDIEIGGETFHKEPSILEQIAYIFENEWQSFRTRQDCALELQSVSHVYARPGRYQVAVKVIDIFGNDTMTSVPVQLG